MFLTKSKRTFLRGLGLLVLPAILAGKCFAEAPTISGFVDTQYVYSFNKPIDRGIELRSFDPIHNDITLNATQLMLSGSLGDAGYTVKFLAGTDAVVIYPGAGHGAQADEFEVQEAFLTYLCPNTKLNLKVGKFVTLQGIEVIESKDDPTISRGYLFGLAEAYTHTGALVTRAFGPVEVGAGVVNGWDLARDNNNGKTVLGKLGFNFGDPLTFSISGSHGPEQARPTAAPFTSVDGNNRSSIDLTGVTKIVPKLALWFQLNAGQEERIVDLDADGTVDDMAKWKGFGVQPVWSVTEKFSIGARAEYFYDDDGARTGTRDLATKNYTIAPGYKLTDNLTMRAEYRMDEANKKIFTKDNGTTKDSASTASLQFLLTF